MKKLLFLLIVFNAGLSQSQNLNPCYFDRYQQAHKEQIDLAEQKIKHQLISGDQNKQINSPQNHNPNLKIIPVVVHIIHLGGTENISDAQVQSQIDVLNEDFRKIAGTNGDGNGVDTDIEYCLAKKDPQGRCTNGIVRVNSSLANHQTYQRTQLKQLSYWDNTRYLNIYVVKTISGSTLGYSSFPGGPPDEDGIVVRHDYFGKTGTASASLGRTTTHEIGHWLGLYHTFNGGCGIDTCLDGDYVCDTPPAVNPNFGCPTINSCSIDVPDVNDQIANYMDYSNDNCKSMFSNGQKQRAQASLMSFRFDIWQQWNIDSTGCDSGFVNGPCNVIADFVTLNPNICIGNQITFYDKSQNNPTSYLWDFQGGTPSTSAVANPAITYTAVGTFQVKLIATNAQGTDSLIWSNYINVTTPPIGQALPYSENFESTTFPTNGITIDNPDGGITWERDTIALHYSGAASAKINNLINTNYGQSDALILPGFDFTTFTGIPYLTYKWAYARSDANYSDEMIVLASKDCGVTWAQLFYRTGAALVTGPTQITPYIPDSTTVWKSANINMNTYATFQNVIIKIVNVTDGGNNLYIDFINLGTLAAGIDNTENESEKIILYPNPSNGIFTLELNEEKLKGELEIVNSLGFVLFKIKISEQENKQQLLLPSLENGIYFIRNTFGDKLFVKRFVILK
ncbi:MAG: T9SS type A sorting domain-containing protein [Bacteroidia bacterium]|nr:T9SS type A sorting domain-containing protein [Bacteroidia bacterium]